MSLLQQPIQRKLSSLLGAEVTFEQFKVSLLKGVIDIAGVTVRAREDIDPLLTIRRVTAEVSLRRLLKKELVIESLTVERPVLSIVRYADGSTNLPRRVAAAEEPQAVEQAGEPPDDDQPRQLHFEAQKVLLVDGEAAYRSEHPADAGYRIAAERILAECSQQGSTIPFTLIVDSLARRDAPASPAALKLTGQFAGAEHLGQLASARLQADDTLGEGLHVVVQSPGLARREVQVELQCKGDLAALVSLLPPSLATAKVPSLSSLVGQVELSLQARFSPTEGLTVPAAHFQIHDLAVAFAPDPRARA